MPGTGSPIAGLLSRRTRGRPRTLMDQGVYHTAQSPTDQPSSAVAAQDDEINPTFGGNGQNALGRNAKTDLGRGGDARKLPCGNRLEILGSKSYLRLDDLLAQQWSGASPPL